MMTHFNRALFWAPRALCILFIAFVSLFALDVFGDGYGFWRTLAALVMHLIPSFVMVAALAVAWRWERVGTVVFAVFGVFFTVVGPGVWIKMTFAAPCFVAASLFFVDWRQKRAQARPAN
jgi:hypothetical protein